MPKYWPFVKSVEVTGVADSETLLRLRLEMGGSEARVVQSG